ncbi:MAG: hypothetical protein F4Y79_22895 [Gemmatimonadetes bacterium]|nr:hypothetical protein [Gemmatimonadota bacterium]
MLKKLDNFKTAVLPERKFGFWQMAGPGAILVGLSIGAGEIIVWPLVVAEYGASMIWAAVLGVFLQMWINFEVGRWTIATGETVYTGFARVWRGFAPLFILITLFSWIAPGWGRASGLALKALLVGPYGWGSDTFWTVITFIGVALILFGPKLIYNSMEKAVELMVAIVTIGLIMVAFAVSTAETWIDLGKGIANIGYKDPNMSVKALFIAIVFAGAGGTANLFYTFYLRDKHIGMGAHVPIMQNPLRSRAEAIPSTGFVFEDTEENATRFKAWWDYIKKDQMLFFWGLNSITMMLFIFGSLAVLHPQGIVPAQGTLIWDEAAILGEIWGDMGRVIFLLVGLATLFGTQLALVDGVSRSIADIVYTNFKGAQKRELSWWYLLVAGIWIVAGCVITFVMEQYGVSELGFLFNAAYMGGFAMAIYVPLMLYINYRYLPKTAQPGKGCTAMMVIASLVYVVFAIACILWEVGILA